MRAWSTPEVPRLEGFEPAPPVTVHDSAAGTARLTEPGETARLYVCGITPYDATHVGHAATYVAFDLLIRAWRDAGHDVHYVQNVTDVDDPLLERAKQTDVDWAELAERETELFRQDMTALRVVPPDEYIGAVESIPLVVEVVQQLRDRGAVYEVEGDLYFSVHADPRFGSVSGLAEDEMLRLYPERGGDPDRPGKKHALDCLLWQAERPGEPSWDSELGTGRPGWHVECAAIALRFLGESFDVQGGGSDLAFPHHEMSASEAQAAFEGLVFAQAYVHTGMVGYEGEKMSKSKGNLVFVSRLRESGVDPNVLRLALLAHHYRQDWEWTDADVPRAEARLAAWRTALDHVTDAQAEELVRGVRDRLADDLDSPGALQVLDDWAADVAEAGPTGGVPGDKAAADTVRTLVDARLGVLL
jgi:L-cysteine:1D-myo-inositol 2-amino-2-deoxy-alpha-D-glucopyranoside ligase